MTLTHSKRIPTMEHSEQERGGNWRRLERLIGQRYEGCRVDSFKTSLEAQRKVRDAVRKYGKDITARVAAGTNIVLYGPPDTGKDHLLVGLLYQACKYSHSIGWVNGMDLHGEIRDAMDGETTESYILKKYTEPTVLAISDPVPPWGDLSKFQAVFLFRLIDARYRAMKPTWVTVNATKGEELEGRIGEQVVDRLRDGALTLHCDWPSYRASSVGPTDSCSADTSRNQLSTQRI